MNLKFPLEEYFKYHPPITDKRKQLHDRVNNDSLQLFKDFATTNYAIEPPYDRGMKLLNDVCTDPTCYKWAQGSLISAKEASMLDFYDSTEKVFMHMQQFRMFLNQAITIQELENEP